MNLDDISNRMKETVKMKNMKQIKRFVLIIILHLRFRYSFCRNSRSRGGLVLCDGCPCLSPGERCGAPEGSRMMKETSSDRVLAAASVSPGRQDSRRLEVLGHGCAEVDVLANRASSLEGQCEPTRDVCQGGEVTQAELPRIRLW